VELRRTGKSIGGRCVMKVQTPTRRGRARVGSLISALFVALVFILPLTVGCAGSPTVPDVSADSAIDAGVTAAASATDINGNHRLWAEGSLYFNADHTRVDVVPLRSGRFHLNAARFLEETCTNCLQILGVYKNGDGTIDMMVRITHPFSGHPEYTGFDVKGIIMFDGSHTLRSHSLYNFPFYEPFRISWRELGDPELLNPDGWSPLWCPEWPSDSNMPMFNYWPGKYSRGTPTANVNGFIEFYTDEQRHMFRHDGSVVRTYHIWLPPGPLIAGYAIDACWALPDVTPVTDPLNDFPISANQDEPYIFKVVANNNEPITTESCCGSQDYDCTELYTEIATWHGLMPNHIALTLWPDIASGVGQVEECKTGTKPYEGTYWISPVDFDIWLENGKHRGVARIFQSQDPELPRMLGYTVFDFTLDVPG
jgi:hypothetical protein